MNGFLVAALFGSCGTINGVRVAPSRVPRLRAQGLLFYNPFSPFSVRTRQPWHPSPLIPTEASGTVPRGKLLAPPAAVYNIMAMI
jgi:hypothetical protein